MRKQYTMDQTRWPGTRAVRFACIPAESPWQGAAGLSVLSGFAAPKYGGGPQQQRIIIDNGFHWLQLAPRDQHWWLTAMFDGGLKLTQFYFDVTVENHILPEGKSWCEDLYLDVVVNPDGSAMLLDAEELQAAYDAGEIGGDLYALAHATAAEIIRSYSGEAAASRLEVLCREYLGILREML